MRVNVRSLDSPNQSGELEKRNPTDPAYEDIKVTREISEKLQKRSMRDPNLSIDGIDDTKPNKDKLKKGLTGMLIDKEQASDVYPQVILDKDLNYTIVSDPSSGTSDMFLPINNISGVMIIRLNTDHPLYMTLQNIIGSNDDEEMSLDKLDSTQLAEKLKNSLDTIRKMIIAYSRAELESAKIRKKDQYEEVRRTWSQIVRDLYNEDDEE